MILASLIQPFRRVHPAICAAFVAALLAWPPPGQSLARTAGTAMTVNEAVNVRTGRGVDFPRTARLLPGDVVTASDPAEGWLAVADKTGRRKGYVFAPLLVPLAVCRESDPGAAPLLMTVDEAANVRSGRGVNFPRTALLSPGTRVRATDLDQGWWAVADLEGRSMGHVFAPLLRPVGRLHAQARPTKDPGKGWSRDRKRGMAPDPGGWDLRLTPSIGLAETYDSNIFFKEVEDLEHTASPGIKFEAATEATRFTARAKADIIRYASHSEFDRENQLCALEVAHAPGPRTTLGLKADIRQDHSFAAALDESAAVADKRRRTAFSLAPRAAWKPAPRHELQLFAERFGDRREQDQDLDRDGVMAGGRWEWSQADERTTLMLEAQSGRTSYHQVSQRLHRALAGISRALGENLRLTAKAGPRLSQASWRTRGTDHRDSAPDMDAEAGLAWSVERGRVEAWFSRTQAPGTQGEDVGRTRLGLAARRELGDRFTAGLKAQRQYARTQGYAEASETSLTRLEPYGSYRLTEDSDIGLSYEYSGQRDRIDDSYRSRHRVWLKLNMDFPASL